MDLHTDEESLGPSVQLLLERCDCDILFICCYNLHALYNTQTTLSETHCHCSFSCFYAKSVVVVVVVVVATWEDGGVN